MHIFVTGSTGFIGSAVVNELLSAGHTVLGLTRSDAGEAALRAQGAEPLRGTIEDVALLRRAAAACDAVAHLAFVHDFANFVASCATDRAAIAALGDGLAARAEAGSARAPALVITSGTMLLPRGTRGTEASVPDTTNPLAAARGASEGVCLAYAARGLRAMVIRLPPSTHGAGGRSGFLGPVVGLALAKGAAGYIGSGANQWCAGHKDDAAVLYRLALENGDGGDVFHAVGEEGVSLKEVAEAVGKELGVPAVSVPVEEAGEFFGGLQMQVGADNTASSEMTREKLGWVPKGPTLVEDIPVVIEYTKSQAH